MTEGRVLRLLTVLQPLAELAELLTGLGHIRPPTQEPLLELIRDVAILGEELLALHVAGSVSWAASRHHMTPLVTSSLR